VEDTYTGKKKAFRSVQQLAALLRVHIHSTRRQPKSDSTPG
jgi:hypothetical protein